MVLPCTFSEAMASTGLVQYIVPPTPTACTSIPVGCIPRIASTATSDGLSAVSPASPPCPLVSSFFSFGVKHQNNKLIYIHYSLAGPVLAFSPTVLGYRLRALGVPQARPPAKGDYIIKRPFQSIMRFRPDLFLWL